MIQYSLHDLKYFQEIIKLSMKSEKNSGLYLNIVNTSSQKPQANKRKT